MLAKSLAVVLHAGCFIRSYPTIGVYNEMPASDPWEYISKAEELLERFQ